MESRISHGQGLDFSRVAATANVVEVHLCAPMPPAAP
jgi:hypothetical protein